MNRYLEGMKKFNWSDLAKILFSKTVW